MSGDQLLGVDVLNTVHGLAQSLHDVRSVLRWVTEEQNPAAIGLYGVSLGGYLTALTAAFEADLDVVIAGIPVSDFPAMFRAQSPTVINERYEEAGILGGPAEALHRTVSPLALEPLVPHDRRFIFAGLADRMSHPRQAHDLWRHWGEPTIEWYPGNHVGYLWSAAVSGFVSRSLAAGFATQRENLGHVDEVTSDG